jgi:hypothetical protein
LSHFDAQLFAERFGDDNLKFGRHADLCFLHW